MVMGLVLILHLLHCFRMDHSPLENLACAHLRRNTVYLVSAKSPNMRVW
jgi:hypothetical protein